ncbi:hypothetical protein EON83_10305 [bacterium]|nr:MAG: hypothetical protein EON83_10305 [bacterium]
MRHYLIFPPLFVAWFIAAQFGLSVLSYASSWLTARSASDTIDLNNLSLPTWSFNYFLWSCAIGLIMGSLFAVLDLKINPNNNDTEETFLRLAPNLLQSGAIAITLIVIFYGAIRIPLSFQLYRLPAPLSDQISLWLTYIPLIILMASLTWSMRKTLHR